jgi:hypothetical protein
MDIIKGWVDPKALRLMRKDPTASQRFIDHCIAIGDVAAELKRIYKSVLHELSFQTKTDIMKMSKDNYDSNCLGKDGYELMIDSFPKPNVDGFIDGWPVDYKSITFPACFVEIWHDSVPFWVYRKRILYLIEYTDDEVWGEWFTGSDTPPFLLVCDNPTLQRRVQRYLRRIFISTNEDDIFLVTNRQALSEATGDDEIWTRVNDEASEIIRLTNAPNY